MGSDAVQQRQTADYVSQDAQFQLRERQYRQQYSALYFTRLLQLRPVLEDRVRRQWPHVQALEILKLAAGVRCAVVGTLYKQMQLKPSILDEYTKERSAVPLVAPAKLVHDDDFLILEDMSGRIRLTGDALRPADYATGVVVAVLGVEQADGEFAVEAVLLPDLPPQPLRPPAPAAGVAPPRYVALVSGLGVGAPGVDPLQTQLLVDHLGGHLGGSQAQQLSARTVRVVLAGDSLHAPPDLLTGQALSAREQAAAVAPIQELDLLLTQLAAALPVDVMPGSTDPANYSLPQQPLHPCLFPGASQYDTFSAATNPHRFSVDGVDFLGTAGQPVADLLRYCGRDDPLALLESTLRWRHLAPTAPDTLACYPFTDSDPFLLATCPAVYFAGNQAAFATTLLQGTDGQRVRLIALPRFADTGMAVLVDLATLEAQPLTVTTTNLGGP
ncbi:DNA polymerase delta regulatory subunit 55 [Klebsormidium nitens]|uniref:DNA polymerase delta regulatory subunit 55 n=1 Tax=Klebsormidium nitens TaxID=105231 RepID=A0A1Y1IIY7_KLENI|nr:DNA polymerase delta regulatory subunit 55 [Klebsormidium nitens]|eukprot:GAQ90764.1 DNA polymerase delta regulatory subunit 55 [Klebsormidium nitens]